jgi:NAD(P)-dependent dehydrogenase (short-subunit alcohol dehydrogenase family)
MTDGSTQTVVVTGASRGIGREIALHLAARGFDVFAGVRNPSASSAQLGHDRVRPLALDVANDASIACAVREVGDAVGGRGLFALVNNAAVFSMGPLEQLPRDAIEEGFRVNVIGTLAVTRAFLPLIRQATGRIVNISSINGLFAVPFSGVYCATKFALEALSDSLRMELAPWNIRVIVVEPGAFRTDIRAGGLDNWQKVEAALDPDARALYRTRHEKIRDQINQFEPQALPPTPVAQTVFDALTTAAPHARYIVGIPAETVRAVTAMPEHERDRELTRGLGD